MKEILSFQGSFRWLSNFAACVVKYDGIEYPTVEHAYQAAKTLDINQRKRIAALPTPGDAKRAGRRVRMREGWDDMKVEVMRGLLRQKYSKSPYFMLLLATGDASIVEGNNWGDTFWGVCRGVGDNMLGRLIMDIRKENRHG